MVLLLFLPCSVSIWWTQYFVCIFFLNLRIELSILFVGNVFLMQNFSPRLSREKVPNGRELLDVAKLKIALFDGCVK